MGVSLGFSVQGSECRGHRELAVEVAPDMKVDSLLVDHLHVEEGSE